MPGTSRRQMFLIGLFLILVVMFMTTFRMGVVSGTSMEPTYNDGQVVLVRRRNLFSPPLRRGDVVLVRNGHDVIIKRIFRLPGEEIDNSYPDVLAPTQMHYLTDHYLTDYYEQQTVQTPQGPVIHYYVPKDFFVVIGDNLPVSEDSRVFGPVALHDVLGVVVAAPPAPYSSGQMPPPSPNGSTLPQQEMPGRPQFGAPVNPPAGPLLPYGGRRPPGPPPDSLP